MVSIPAARVVSSANSSRPRPIPLALAIRVDGDVLDQQPV
jgi:hypothetical protein